jgi:hypothetical protein
MAVMSVAYANHRAQALALVFQWRKSHFDPFVSTRDIYRTEIKPGKHSDTRIKPLPLANGHGRYIAVTPERKIVSVWVMAVAYSRFASETVT